MADAIENPVVTDSTGIVTYNLAQVAAWETSPGYELDQDVLEDHANLDNDTGRIAKYQVYRDWYKGSQGEAEVSERLQAILEETGIPFADNFADLIVDAPVRRLKLAGLTFTPENDIAEEVTTKIMRQNRMDIGSSRVHHNAVKLGDAFLVVDYSQAKGHVTLTYNRPDIMRPEYDDDTGEEMLWCSKVWQTKEISPFNPEPDTTIERMNIYWPDRIEKYYRSEDGGDWLPFMDVATDSLWPIPWIDEKTKQPLGIPVFHFRNMTLDDDFGVSEIHKAIPQQGLLNKWLMDTDLIMDAQGYPQRWIAGVDSVRNDDDETADSGNFDGGPGEVLTSPNPETKFGQFDPADLSGPLSAIDMLVRHMSASNATPIDDLLGNKQASGEALKMKDSGLSDKAEEKEMSFGNVWEDVYRYAHKIRNIYAQGETAVVLDDTDISANWSDTAPRNEKAVIEVLKGLVELGASEEWALNEYGVENVSMVLAQAAAEKDNSAERDIRAITRGADTLVDPVTDGQVEE